MPKGKQKAADDTSPPTARESTSGAFLAGKFVQPHLLSHLFCGDSPPLKPFTPEAELRVEYPTALVDMGIQLEKRALAPVPSVSTSARGDLFTLIAADVDAPSPYTPTQRSYLLWFVINIPGAGSGSRLLPVQSGRTLVKYASPSPQRSNHRIVYLLCRQEAAVPEPSEGLAAVAAPARAGFSIPSYLAGDSAGAHAHAHAHTSGSGSGGSSTGRAAAVPVAIDFCCVHAPEWGSK